jgi:hypothetical protein
MPEERSDITLGLKPYNPFIKLGIRIEPPMSVPQPIMEPWSARRAPSPPVEPPGVKFASSGLVVNPQRGFSVSHHYLNFLSINILKPQKHLKI